MSAGTFLGTGNGVRMGGDQGLLGARGGGRRDKVAESDGAGDGGRDGSKKTAPRQSAGMLFVVRLGVRHNVWP